MKNDLGGKNTSMRRRFLARLSGLLLALPLLTAHHAWAWGAEDGDAFLLDAYGGTNRSPALLKMDVKTGATQLVSDFGNPAQGPTSAEQGSSVTVSPTMEVFVTDFNFSGSTIFKVDPVTGRRQVVSNFAQGNPSGTLPYGLDVDSDGRLVSSLLNAEGAPQRVVRVNPKTDRRKIITDLRDTTQGSTETDRSIHDLTVDAYDNVIIATSRCNGTLSSIIYNVNRRTGQRRVLSDFSNALQGTGMVDLCTAIGMTFEKSGRLLVSTANIYPIGSNLIMRVSPWTGRRTVVSNFDDPAQGPVGSSLHGLAVTSTGDIIVAAQANPMAEIYSIFKVHPTTGQRKILASNVGLIIDLAIARREK